MLWSCRQAPDQRLPCRSARPRYVMRALDRAPLALPRLSGASLAHVGDEHAGLSPTRSCRWVSCSVRGKAEIEFGFRLHSDLGHRHRLADHSVAHRVADPPPPLAPSAHARVPRGPEHHCVFRTSCDILHNHASSDTRRPRPISTGQSMGSDRARAEHGGASRVDARHARAYTTRTQEPRCSSECASLGADRVRHLSVLDRPPPSRERRRSRAM